MKRRQTTPKSTSRRTDPLLATPVTLPILAQFTAQPDGTYKMKPTLPTDGVDVWITPAQACKILGVKGAGIYRLIDPAEPFLLFRRPLPRKILISLRSVRALSEATKDAEFWESRTLKEELRRTLRNIAANKG
jgi:hypothetical protein